MGRSSRAARADAVVLRTDTRLMLSRSGSLVSQPCDISARPETISMRMVYEKYSVVNDLLKSDVRSLLDVGCRDAILRKHMRPQIEYTGVDIVAGPGVDKVANIEDGLPFADGEFDAVVALDLLEHTNNIWFAFDELVRVARRQVVIVLPNVYHWSSRVRFLLGREMDKYALPAQSIVDRHRWLP